MRLKTLDYVQYAGRAEEWKIDGLTLGEFNLIVGKNASGKTRVLNIISGLAKLLSGEIKVQWMSGDYNARFDDEAKSCRYKLAYENSEVITEEYRVDNKQYLRRVKGGGGFIWAEKLQQQLEFQVPPSEVAVFSRRDSIQHPFFEPLHKWGQAVFHYQFGTDLGKRHLALLKEGAPEANPKDPEQVIGIFRKGEREFGEKFKNAIKEDMGAIGYEIQDIGVSPLTTIVIFPSQPFSGLYVKEANLNHRTEHVDISQGMFRALSILIQINYAQLALSPGCLLIDDIGEGLDFERSCSLIELLMAKSKQKSVQLIMATNDRFVMNKVPLEAWTILQRSGNGIQIFNYGNSKRVFDEFKFTGMNNFDLFATNFVKERKNAQ